MLKIETFQTDRAGRDWFVNLWEGEYPFRVQIVASDIDDLDIDNRYRDFDTKEEAKGYIERIKLMINSLKPDSFTATGHGVYYKMASSLKSQFLTQLLEA